MTVVVDDKKIRADDILRTTNEIANLLKVKPDTLNHARSSGSEGYPPHIKIGRRVFYIERVVLDWLENRLMANEGWRYDAKKAI